MNFRVMNRCIVDSEVHPFGRSSYISGEKISDFVGRTEELRQFKDYLQIIYHSKFSLAVRLEGPAGVGKSTLFNYLKESIQKEKLNSSIPAHYLKRNIDILSTYFPRKENVVKFKDLWSGILDNLQGEIEEETGADLGFLEYVALNLVYHLLKEDENLTKMIWNDTDPPHELRYISLTDIIDPILDNPDFVPKIQEYVSNNRKQIRSSLYFEVDGKKNEIKRRDTNWILDLLYVLDEEHEMADKLYKGDLFKTDDDLISYFNSLCRLYMCSTKKELIMLVGIDEIVKFSALTSNYSEFDFYTNLGKLLIKIRDQLKNILFVFISTTDDWNHFDQAITSESDIKGQLRPILKIITLKQLHVYETIKVFENRMTRFWKKYPERSSEYPFYPFNREFFEYVYRYKQRNLRRAIEFLHSTVWNKFRNGDIPVIRSMFDAMGYIRKLDDMRRLDGVNFETFELNMLKEYFNNSEYSKTNAKRSAMIEKGLAAAWRCIRQDLLTDITDVRYNKVIIVNGKKRRPDVLLELNGNLGGENVRYLEFQVKAYVGKSTIKIDDIESSIDLFKNKKIDYLYFITTGKGFDPKAESLINSYKENHWDRIITPILQENQEKLLIFLALHDKILGRKLGESPAHLEKDLETSMNIMEQILNQDIFTFLNNVKKLDKYSEIVVRGGLEEYFLEEGSGDEIEEKSDENDKNSIKIDGGSAEGISGIKVKKWVEKYPEFSPFLHEACGLGEYMTKRESGRLMHKFTFNVIKKNVISKDPLWYDLQRLKDMIDKMLETGYLTEVVKKSYKFTDLGIQWYNDIKKDNFKSE